MSISDLRWDFILVCFKESGDAQRNVHMGGLLSCSLLGEEELGVSGLGMGPALGRVNLRDLPCSQVSPGFIDFVVLLRHARIHQ